MEHRLDEAKEGGEKDDGGGDDDAEMRRRIQVAKMVSVPCVLKPFTILSLTAPEFNRMIDSTTI